MSAVCIVHPLKVAAIVEPVEELGVEELRIELPVGEGFGERLYFVGAAVVGGAVVPV